MEAVPPQITPADANAVKEVPASKDDIYRAQLQLSKAGKVQAAEDLLGKAANDPKVKKLINKKPTRGKGAQKRGVKTGGDKTDEGKGVKVPEGDQIADQSSAPNAPNEDDKANKVDEGQWKDIDTWYTCSAVYVFISSVPCTKQKSYMMRYIICTTLSIKNLTMIIFQTCS